MNPAFNDVLSAPADTRSGLFTATAQRLGTTPQNVEKDFWVCWTLDALFNGLPPGPRLLFKRGTSLSKGFGLIKRFSEDIDVTVFRDDLGAPASVNELAALSAKKRKAALEAIREACESFINGALAENLTAMAAEACTRNRLPAEAIQVRPDPADGQTLLLAYPTSTPTDDYITKTVKIESGAKSALDPNSIRTIKPYIDDDLPATDLAVPGITVVDAARTFWDKIVIVHGLTSWYSKRGELRGNGQRVSRHYYDLHQMLQSDIGRTAMKDRALGANCVEHARMFYNRPDFDLSSAHSPTFTLRPHYRMIDDLRRDYAAMSSMIFGDAPRFNDITESIAALEQEINAE